MKARQKGISKIIDADQLLDSSLEGANSVIVSHEKEATKRLFSSVRSFVENARSIPKTSIDSKSEMKFIESGGSYFIGTAGQKAFGRGDTVDRAHLSEAAFYENLERILNGIAEAAEYGQIDIETTPNGRGELYDMVQKAKEGLSSYTFIFIPWFIDQEYSVENFTEKERQGLSKSVREMIDMPDEEFMKTLTEEEKAFKKRAEEEWKDEDIVITPGMLKWRRYKIWDKGESFFQEYPEDDESCFLQSARSVFKNITIDPSLKIPLDDVDKMKQEDKDRLLGEFDKLGNRIKGKRPKLLYAGIDPAEGTLTGDSHVFAVIEPNSPYAKNNGAVVIFEMHSNEPIDIFAAKVKKVMDVFDILVGIEHQGVGVAMGNKFKDLDLIFTEWNTTGTSRPILITDLEEAYRKETLIETYSEAEGEARNMIYNTSNRPEHQNGKHDDRVFARGIALQMFNQPKPNIEFF